MSFKKLSKAPVNGEEKDLGRCFVKTDKSNRKIYKCDYIDIIKMIETESQIREWGRSIGVVIPKDAVIKERIKTGDVVKLLIRKKTNPIKKTFGMLKFKKSTDEILKESDKECWDE